MDPPRIIRWGILGTGYIAKQYAMDLLVHPKTRGIANFVHEITAVGSSSSVDVANDFIQRNVMVKQSTVCKAHGSYEELAQDENLDIVYIATPHSHHFQNAMLCLEANKHVVIEKPLTVNANQARLLYEVAKERNLFLMEAMWTRFLPVATTLQAYIRDNAVGEILRVTTELCIPTAAETFDKSHRMVNKNLAGGVLLDLGVYNLCWIFHILYNTLPRTERLAPKLSGSAMVLDPRTGTDITTALLLEFPKCAPSRKLTALGEAFISLGVDRNPDKSEEPLPSIKIQGEQGHILVYGGLNCPNRIKVVPKDGAGNLFDERFGIHGEGTGMFFEADEAARCIVSGLTESALISQQENIAIMDIMDQVRRGAGLQYPEYVETTEYPTRLVTKLD